LPNFSIEVVAPKQFLKNLPHLCGFCPPFSVVLNALAVSNLDHKDTMEYLPQLFRDKHLHLSLVVVLQFHLQMKLAAVCQGKLSIFHFLAQSFEIRDPSEEK